MATILDKDITRESTVKVDNREIMITLTEDQKISMKLKGMKSGSVDISIGDLYHQLNGGEKPKKILAFNNEDDDEDNKPMVKNDLSSYKGDTKYLISIHEIRAAANVRDFDIETTVKFDTFLSDLIKERKESINKNK